jgi:ABC-2 type transport system permease protein
LITQLLSVMKKEVRQTFRDKRMASVLIVAPVLQLTLLGFAVDLDVDRIPTAVVDRDRTRESRELIRGFLADGTFAFSEDVREPDLPLLRGDAKVVVVIPEGLAKDLAKGRSAEVQVLVDGSNPIVAQAAINSSIAYFRLRGLNLALERIAASPLQTVRPGSIDARPRILFNPRLRSTTYMVPGVAAVVLMLVTTIVTAMGIARERELGTIEQLLVTPMRPSTLLLGKTIPFALIGLVVAHLVIAVGTNLFDVPIRGSLLAFLVVSLVYLMTTLGAGILISTLAKTQQQAMLGGIFFILPAFLLSGFMSPIDNMPEWVQLITWINPVRHYVEALRAILLKGSGVVDIARPLGVLVVFGAVILTLASLRFRKRLA